VADGVELGVGGSGVGVLEGIGVALEVGDHAAV
jgi:hypothetical protein